MKNFDDLFDLVREHPVRKVAVAVAQDHTVLQAAKDAEEKGLADAILFGDRDLILAAADTIGYDPGDDIVHEPDPRKAALAAVSAASSGEADIVMKGYVHTDDFLRAVLHKEKGLRTGAIMSHVFIMESRSLDRLLFITDAAMNIAPDLEQKAGIILNAVHMAHAFGVAVPRVAVLTAVELVNPKMQATLDASALAQMSRRGQFSVDCIVDGPYAFDNAISELAAAHKKIEGPVAGKADVLVVPTVEAGNILAKSLVYLGGQRLAGLLVGAKTPVVVTSRADTAETKLLSIAAAVFTINLGRHLWLKVGKVRY